MPRALSLLVAALLLTAKVATSQAPSVTTWEQDMNAAQQDVSTGRLAAEEGRLDEALQLAKAFPPDDRRRVRVLHQLADVYHSEGNDASAEDLLKEELEINQKTYGPNDLHVAASMDALAFVYTKMGRNAQAASLYQQALAIQEKTVGPEHEDMIATQRDYAALQHKESHH